MRNNADRALLLHSSGKRNSYPNSLQPFKPVSPELLVPPVQSADFNRTKRNTLHDDHSAPIDDPTLHQGRIRARPWIQGEYPAHIYLERESMRCHNHCQTFYTDNDLTNFPCIFWGSLLVKLSKRLRERLGEVIDRAQSWIDNASREPHSADQDLMINPPIHPLFTRTTDPLVKSTPQPNNPEPNSTQPRTTPSHPTLHISLSHPLPLRAFQIPLLLDHMRRFMGNGHSPLRVGLEGGFRGYTNGTQSEGDEREPGDEDEEDDDEVRGIQRVGAGKKVLDDLGRRGMGRKSRGFLALRVGAGHDKVSEENPEGHHHLLPTQVFSQQLHTNTPPKTPGESAFILLSTTAPHDPNRYDRPVPQDPSFTAVPPITRIPRLVRLDLVERKRREQPV